MKASPNFRCPVMTIMKPSQDSCRAIVIIMKACQDSWEAVVIIMKAFPKLKQPNGEKIVEY